MKTKIALLWAMVAGVMLMSACVGIEHLGVLDESIPEEQQCLLEVRNNMRVVLFNNQPVDWYPGSLTKDKITIYVPPGDNTFVVTYVVTTTWGDGYTTNRTVSKTVGAEFLPGHSYRIYMQSIWLFFVTIRNVKIKDVTPKEK
jgi:hypothetical protein